MIISVAIRQIGNGRVAKGLPMFVSLKTQLVSLSAGPTAQKREKEQEDSHNRGTEGQGFGEGTNDDA